MHMADALLSPAVGGAMWAASAAALGLAVKKIAGNNNQSGSVTTGLDEKKIPLMGIMGAFVFAGQMINFTIPGTGSSGHIGGGVLLAALLGPQPALITLASVLIIQCLFFADGGLLAYGCNVFNMGVCSALLAYPFVFKPLVKKSLNAKTITVASILAVVAGLQAGAFCVVLETLFSGVTELPFTVFVLLMQPIHLAIGLVEGAVTAAVICFVYKTQPEMLDGAVSEKAAPAPVSAKKVLVVLAALTLVVAGLLSLFASAHPDGLEWAMEKTAGTAELEREGPVYEAAGNVVEKTAFMPDYAFKENESPAGTSVAGLAGSAVTLALAVGAALLIRAVRKKTAS
ncbi:MAG: energy-coupling factor ABC transporter permease [Spirochaetaceae bacterium]|jgi:cobalt/nickel transport system permease protein|nr:energy-coupling factor ABC transporter permease [Spirochaetaceae bacterium]